MAPTASQHEQVAQILGPRVGRPEARGRVVKYLAGLLDPLERCIGRYLAMAMRGPTPFSGKASESPFL
jgi:hypothetical protein